MVMNIIADHTYHVIELEKLTFEVVEWLNDSFGLPGQRWWMDRYKIYFRDSRDHLMFLITWSK
jgi:hypothetical protein